MNLGGIKLTPSVLAISFGLWLVAIALIAGWYVPAGSSLGQVAVPSAILPSSPVANATAARSVPVVAAASARTLTPTMVPTQRPMPTATSTPAPPPTPAPTNTPTPAPFVTYTIKSGDTLSQIAERFGVKVDAIVRYNGLRSADDIKIDDKVTIPTSSSAPSAPPATPASAPAAPAPLVHTVKPGDTLSEIADQYGVKVDAIVRYNGLRSADDLNVGDRITIPR